MLSLHNPRTDNKVCRGSPAYNQIFKMQDQNPGRLLFARYQDRFLPDRTTVPPCPLQETIHRIARLSFFPSPPRLSKQLKRRPRTIPIMKVRTISLTGKVRYIQVMIISREVDRPSSSVHPKPDRPLYCLHRWR